MWHSTGETGQTQTDNPRLTQKQLSNDTIKNQSHFLIFPVYLILTFMSADIFHKRQTNNALFSPENLSDVRAQPPHCHTHPRVQTGPLYSKIWSFSDAGNFSIFSLGTVIDDSFIERARNKYLSICTVSKLQR